MDDDILEHAQNTIHKVATVAWEMTDPIFDNETIEIKDVLIVKNFHGDQCWIQNTTCQEGYCSGCQIYIKWRHELNKEGLI